MNHDEIGLVIGGLLHDIGKAVYRQGGERKNHSELGYAFLKEKIGVKDADLLACVRYHHSDDLKNAHLAADAPTYIVYMADNMASAADRREKEQAEEFGFDQQTPLQPVFNLLNGNHGDKWYAPGILAVGEDHTADQINFPVAEKAVFSREQYDQIVAGMTDRLRGINWDQPQDYINSILETLEANLSFVPASTAKGEVPDISLYDRMKMTGAMAACIGQYLKAQSIQDYREVLFKQATAFYDRDVFLLASLDLSGIQGFIYTITSEDALRMLRARSFYLDLLVEHIVDSMLERLSLTRCNLIYAGGGHCYLLLPNTEQAKRTFDNCLASANQWFLAQFGAALYIAGGYVPCSSNVLCDEPKGEGRYAALFRAVSSKLSKQKMQRYSADDIRALNQRREKNYARECAVCKKIGAVNESGRCPMCEALKQLSAHVLYDWFFAITKAEDAAGVPLPFNSVLRAAQEESDVKAIIQNDPDFVRVYGKNQMYTGERLATKLWAGDYTTGDTFEDFAKQAQGIRRIAVLRADVDNLGHSFVAGFDDPANQNRYVTLSRTATLSRQLSLFFKFYINKILESPQFSLTDARPEKRAATIVYSGGDDVFIVGAWDQVIALAIDLKNALAAYTDNTLTLSAGIGIYPAKYPISAMAEEVAALEDQSKHYPGKNAVTIFDDGKTHRAKGDDGEAVVSDGTTDWETFEKQVIGEKLRVLRAFFDRTEDRGKGFLYRILDLIRRRDDKINFARLVYLLARLEPDQKAPEAVKAAYAHFETHVVRWVQNPEDARQLKTAIYIYAYLTREEEENDEEH